MIKNYYVEIELISGFNVIVETLTRIGILNDNAKELYQTCHIFHNSGRFFLVHFKELFSMFSFKNDNKVEEEKIHMTEDDFYRRNSIIFLLSNWKLIKLIDEQYILENKGNIKLFIVPHKEKNNYNLVSKFTLGNKK